MNAGEHQQIGGMIVSTEPTLILKTDEANVDVRFAPGAVLEFAGSSSVPQKNDDSILTIIGRQSSHSLDQEVNTLAFAQLAGKEQHFLLGLDAECTSGWFAKLQAIGSVVRKGAVSTQ